MATSGTYKYTIATNLELYVSWTTSYSQGDVTVKQKAYIRYKGSLQGTPSSGSTAFVSQQMPDVSASLNPIYTFTTTSATTANYVIGEQSATYHLTETSTNVYASKTLSLLKTTVQYLNLTLDGTTYSAPSGGWVASASNVVIDGRNYTAPTITVTVSGTAADALTITAASSDDRPCTYWGLYINGVAKQTYSGIASSWAIDAALLALSPGTTYTAYVTAISFPENVQGTSNTVTFTTASQNPPTVNVTARTIASDYVELNISASETCNTWKYVLDGVEHSVSGASTTSVTAMLQQLTPGTTYQVSASAKSVANNVIGTSQTISVTTTAKTLFTTSTYSAVVDENLDSIDISVKLADKFGSQQGQTTFRHDLTLTSSTLQSIELLTKQQLVNGSNTVSLSSADISWIDSLIGSSGSVTLTLVLITYNDQAGTIMYGTDNATITFTKVAPEAPIFSDFTYSDTNATTVAITNNNQILIKGYSNLAVYAVAAQGQHGATIVSYSAVFGENTGQSSSTTINLGTVKSSGTANIVTTATDSNGLTASVAKSATSIDYSKVTMGSLSLTRPAIVEGSPVDNHVYATVTIPGSAVSGSFSPIVISNVDKNDIVSVTYQYRQSDSLTWLNGSADISGYLVKNGNTFTITNAQLQELSRDYSWFVRIIVSDKLSSNNSEGSILGDVPLMSFRSGKVGINNKNPNSALDVIGNIEMNGFNVQGFVRALGSGDDLNTILATGIYTADPNGTYTGLHYPTSDKGVLEVIPETGGLVHRFTKVPVDGKVWIRHYTTQTTSFGQWYQLSGSGAFTQEQSDWNEDDDTKVTFIKNKPVVPAPVTKTSQLQNDGSDGTSTYLEADENAYRASSIPFGVVDGTSTKNAFTATVPGITELRDGVCMWLKNGVVTSASPFTININGLGAKPAYSNLAAATRETTKFNINYTLLFIYDSTRVEGGCWVIDNGYDSNTNTIGYQLRTANSTLPAQAKFYRYRLLFTSADQTKWVPANTSTSTNATASRDVNQTPIDPFGEITYYGTTTAIEADAEVPVAQLWQQYPLTLGYSFNRTGAALVLPFPSMIYIKCTPQSNGSAIIDANEPYVTSLPSTEDGKIYILLGRTYSATNVELLMKHPIYYYKDGSIRPWVHVSGIVASAYCDTDTLTSAKTATCTDFVLRANSYLHVLMKNSNGALSAVTFNVNNTGAIPVYINGEPSSVTNYLIPAGTYIVFYDGTAYNFRTDGKLPGRILAADSVPWSGITSRPTVSHAHVELLSGTNYELVIDNI